MIPAKTVQDILEATRIEEVVEDFVALRKRGVNLIGLCPFHNEKTPSFNVSPTRNIFKCFGCGKGGDAVTFLMEHESYTYPEALRWLARKYHIEVEEVQRSPEQQAEQQREDALYIVNDFALKHFQEQLFDTDEGKSVALSYFRKRGLREDTIREFGLGYAPEQWDLLLRQTKSAQHSVDLLKQLGLCNQEGARDFFRGRVMFAIHNFSGKVAAFAGRTMSADKNTPKYINSPESPIYVKNKILYGAFQAKKAIRQLDECILVEGYMDVISLHQAGIRNVVASSGTSLTEGQLQLIKRNTANLKILYDGDPAGIKAALRGLDLALEQDLNVRIVLLPEGEDPDSYVQKVGVEAFTAYISEQAKDFILFKANLLLAETKGDPVKKAALVRDIVSSIARIPDPIKRSVYLKECSALLEVSETALVSASNQMITEGLRKRSERDARAAGHDPGMPQVPPPTEKELLEAVEKDRAPAERSDERQEQHLVALLIKFGSQELSGGLSVARYILADIEETLDIFDNTLCRDIVRDCLQAVEKGVAIDQQYFMNHASKAVRELAIDVMMAPYDNSYSPNWEEKFNLPLQNQKLPDLNFEQEAKSALNHFKLRKIRKMIQFNAQRIKAAQESGNEDDFSRYTKVHLKLKSAEKEVSRIAGITVF